MVFGYGQGGGLSQTGADALSNQGNPYNEILVHFYTGAEILKLE